VTTQNLDGKKTSAGREGWHSILIVAVRNLVGFTTRAVAKIKATVAIGVRSRILPMKNASLFLPSVTEI